jgi:hypothetical protein
MTAKSNRVQAVILSVALMLPAGSMFARTRHHHYSRTRGAAVGAVAGALIAHRHPVKGALIGAAAGNAVQAVRSHTH